MKLFGLLSLLLTFLNQAQAGIYHPENRTLISADKYAAVVAIDRDPFASQSAGCAGVFIAQDLVLTAKHCPVSRFKIFASQLNVSEPMVGVFQPKPRAEEWDGFLRPVENGGAHDFAIHRAIWFPGKKPAKVETLPFYMSPAVVGQPVSIVGFPIDLEGYLNESYGEILSPAFNQAVLHPGEVFVVYNCSQTTQNSGGPLLDQATSAIMGVVSNSAAGGSLKRDNPDLQMHSKAVPTPIILSQSSLALQVAEGEALTEPYSGQVLMAAKSMFEDLGVMDVPVSVYKIDGSRARLELLNLSLPLSRLGESGNLYQALGVPGLLVELKAVQGEKRVEIRSWPNEFFEQVFLLSPLNWFYPIYKTDKKLDQPGYLI